MQSLVLLTIRSISFFSPRTIFQPQHMMCVSGVFERVARVFLEESQALSARLSKYEQGFVSLSCHSKMHLSLITSHAGPPSSARRSRLAH